MGANFVENSLRSVDRDVGQFGRDTHWPERRDVSIQDLTPCLVVGSALLLAHGWQFHGSWQQMLGHDFLEEQRFDIGLRREF